VKYKLINELTLPPSLQPANSQQLTRNLKDQFTPKAEAGYVAVSTFSPVLRETLATAAANAKVTLESRIKVYALRVKASLFGHIALKEPQYEPATLPGSGVAGPQTNLNAGNLKPQATWPEWTPALDEAKNTLFLDSTYDSILSRSLIAVETLKSVKIYHVTTVKTLSRSAYGISGKTTRIELDLDKEWWDPAMDNADISPLRTTIAYAQSDELELAEEPFEDPVCGGTDELIELDGFYEGLESGRWVIVSGEREIGGTSGVRFSELAMLAAATQDTKKIKANKLSDSENGGQERELPGDKTHTFIKLAEKLQFCFKRDTVTIYGNVVKATQGETRNEVLGSGDGSKPFQAFTLKQPPLTFVASPTPAGAESTLKVYVNDVKWYEVDTLAGLSPIDRRFITKTDDDSKTTVIFGNGTQGARLPTGLENIKAEYRNGIGKPGNVKAGQITLLTTRPLGVKEVVNPLRASGGADRESRDQARKNAPLAVTALDRLVSVQDYEDFARTFAGIGKARAAELSDGRRRLVHLTIAGVDDIPIDETSDLFRNLRQAIHDFGDPAQPFQLAVRELMLLVISAQVRIQPGCQWELVKPKVQAALLDAFGFERRELGQDARLSGAFGVIMQAVRDVKHVDIDVFGGIPEKEIDAAGKRRLLTPEEITDKVRKLVEESQLRPKHRVPVNLAGYEGGVIRPAQIAFLSSDVSATLILNQIP
jgi:baseplate J-like protein